ncbi:MAG: MFS transporter [Deltaproteobacteria bacterium]|nr:MFS transporter [Deltaproteobacteria bacterium]
MKDYDRIARKITIVLFLSQSLSSAGFIAAFTVNALVGIDLTGQQAMAGVPGAIYTVGQACGAVVWGFSMEKIGRRWGIALGQVFGVMGSVIAVAAVVNRSFPFFLFGLLLVGMARSAVDLGRFAAAEVHLPEKRGRAISNVVLGSTVGAIFGPLLVGPAGQLATRAGYPELAGAYLGVAVILVLASGLIFGGLRPDPRDIGRELTKVHPSSIARQTTRSLAEIIRQPGVIVAMVTMAFAQIVMMIPMSITSVHMKAHQHPLTLLSLVISAHAIGMYAFSLISGRMTDRQGRGPVIIMGSIMLIISCLMAAPSVNFLPLTAALFLLGLGWNFAYVAGSTLLADQLSPGERSKTQGFNDLILNLASGVSQIGSGVIYAIGGFGVMSLAAAAMAVVPLCLAIWWQVRGKSVSGANV